MSANYIPLDPNIQAVLNQPAFGFTIGQTPAGGFVPISSFILFIILAASGVAAIARVLYALGLKTANSNNEAKLTEANKIITTTLGSLLMLFSLTLLLLKVNPDMVTGNVDFSKVVASSMKVGSQTPAVTSNQAGATGNSAACSDETTFKNNINANGPICQTTTCTALSGCDTTTYASIINQEAQKQGVNPKLVTILMCRESRGKKDAFHLNDPPNSIDCGLMQINKPGATACSAEDYDPQTNIAKGVSLIKTKYSALSQKYPGVSSEMMVSASYNCCSTGNPNDASKDCSTGTGYAYTLPKWACPTNPGQTSTNMCFVKNYVCDVAACLSQL